MLAYIRMQGFKCFFDQTVPLAPLTILAGANNTGKSSVIQALLLLRQGDLEKRLFYHNVTLPGLDTSLSAGGKIPLNGQLVHLGTAKDVFCQWAEEDHILFSIAFMDLPDKVFSWKCSYKRDYPDDLILEVVDSNVKDKPPRMTLFSKTFTYLGADRIGSQLIYPVSETSSWRNVGTKGEFTVYCLNKFEDWKIKLTKLIHSSQDQSQTLLYQVEEWMKELVPDIMIKSDYVSQADILYMGIRNYKHDTDFLRPTNVGFGISYSLPIIVAGLMSNKNSMLIVENPEAHLHPGAQSRMGQFLCRLASAGVQVIVETHSDHILNGIRIAAKRKIIKDTDITINYFNNNYELINPMIDSDGRIDKWPEGFFDQMEKDLQELM